MEIEDHFFTSAADADFQLFYDQYGDVSGVDAAAVSRRLDWLKKIPRLRATPEAEDLAEKVAKLLQLLRKAAMGADHVALSIFHNRMGPNPRGQRSP